VAVTVTVTETQSGRISVLLPFRDASSTLAEAMKSVLDDLEPDDELLAIDDGSSDGSVDVAAAVAVHDRRVVVLESGGSTTEPAGIAVALNRGIAAARGALLGRMDADDVSLRGRFAAQRALLASDASLGAVGVQVEAFPAPGGGMQRYLAWQNALLTPGDHGRAIFVEAPLCHPTALIRRAALEHVGGFREVAWPQDYDLWLRLDAAGFGLAKVPRILFRWRIHDSSVTWTSPKNAAARFLEARATFLAQRLRALDRATSYAVWGAGQTGRRLVRALEQHGLRPVAFVDIDPAKIGRRARDVLITPASEGIARATGGDWLLVIAVGEAGARELVRERLSAAGLVEGVAFVCAA
jgi:GT2 family glycosyltransferase